MGGAKRHFHGSRHQMQPPAPPTTTVKKSIYLSLTTRPGGNQNKIKEKLPEQR